MKISIVLNAEVDGITSESLRTMGQRMAHTLVEDFGHARITNGISPTSDDNEHPERYDGYEGPFVTSGQVYYKASGLRGAPVEGIYNYKTQSDATYEEISNED